MSHQVDPIDRGWELLESGDLAGAEAVLRKAVKRDPGSAEVLCLGAAVAAAHGEVDDALEQLTRAAAADPDDPHALLQAAELHLYSRGEAAAALALVERALPLVEDDEERVDVLLLCAEAELLRDDEDAGAEGALAAMEQVEELVFHDPVLFTRAGLIYLELDDGEQAERAFLSAIDEDPSQSDAHHGLGLVYEHRGDREAMIKAWSDTRRLDELAPPPLWHISTDEFQRVAEEAMEELPPEVLDRLENVPILIEDLPGEHLVREGYDPRLLGLFSGVALPNKSHVAGQVPAIDAVHLYQRNLERQSNHREQLLDEIRTTVLHETAHFFGLDDDDLDKIGLG